MVHRNYPKKKQEGVVYYYKRKKYQIKKTLNSYQWLQRTLNKRDIGRDDIYT